MRKQKYGVRAADVAEAVRARGVECSERAAQGALKAFADDGRTFRSPKSAAAEIIEYRREYAKFPRPAEDHAARGGDSDLPKNITKADVKKGLVIMLALESLAEFGYDVTISRRAKGGAK